MTDGIVKIHGKDYVTVAKRLEEARDKIKSIDTEVISHNPVVVKATVTIGEKTYSGISSVPLDTAKQIERANPYEVSETSALGRALGFAGYGVIDTIASAEEVIKSERIMTGRENTPEEIAEMNEEADAMDEKPASPTCDTCGKPAVERSGVSKAGRKFHGLFCSTNDGGHTQWLPVNA